ncbi:LysR family transcriptional regulator [Streptomyces sp. NPDC093544]|uniref:LysR family transcriptional regulator n=1 Tax=Streptomyces sp. NPDC093544 TaxID=3155200 RepID=UPI00343D9255
MWHTRDLKYFVAVAEHQHFTRAANALYVSQSALSKQVASLERTVGAQLFDRMHDGARLTPPGEALLPYARQVLLLSEQAESAVRRAATRGKDLTIGFWLSPGNGLISEALRTLGSSHPGTRVTFRRADWSEPTAGIDTHHCDVALLWVDPGFVLRGMHQIVLASESLVLAMPPSHPLAQQDLVHVDALVDEVMLAIPPGTSTASAASRRLTQLGAASCLVRAIDETQESIMSGLGVIAVPQSIAAAHLRPPIVTRPLVGATGLDLVAAWRPSDESHPELRALVECLVQAAPVALHAAD